MWSKYLVVYNQCLSFLTAFALFHIERNFFFRHGNLSVVTVSRSFGAIVSYKLNNLVLTTEIMKRGGMMMMNIFNG